MQRPVLNIGRRVRLRHVRAAVESVLAPGAHLLDAGCSDGRLAVELARSHPDCEFVGIDVDDAALAAARRMAARLTNLTIDRRTIGDGAADAAFDVVVCADVLEHVGDDAGALRWLASGLRPSGHLIVHVPADPQRHAIHSVGAALDAEVESGAGPHMRMGYTPEGLRELVDEAGLGSTDVAWTFHRGASRLAADLDTWTFLRGGRLVKLVLLPGLLALAALERSPSRTVRGNGVLLLARAAE
jgi:SAM-dependent methyltransferase